MVTYLSAKQTKLVRSQYRTPITLYGEKVYTAASKTAESNLILVQVQVKRPSAWVSGVMVAALGLEPSSRKGVRVRVSLYPPSKRSSSNRKGYFPLKELKAV